MITTASVLIVYVEVIKLMLIIISALMTSITISFTETIAFVGLIVPHITRPIVSPNNRVLFLCSILFGELF